MKLLHEIVKEEIAAFYPAQPRIEGGQIRIDIEAVKGDYVRRADIAHRRFIADPAAAALAESVALQIWVICAAPAPAEEKRRAYVQAIIECLIIWEGAHRRFGEQLSGGEPERIGETKP